MALERDAAPARAGEAGAQHVGLERHAVGLPTAISAVFGLIVATSVLVSISQGFAASWIFLVAMAIGLLAMYLQAMSLSELATMIPKAGSMNEYVRAGLGAFFASLTVLMGYVAIQVFTTSAEAFLPAAIITGFLGGDGLDPKWWVVIIVGAVAVLNVAGVRPFSLLEIVLTFTVAGSLLALGLIGVLGLGSGAPAGGVLPAIPFSWGTLSSLLGLAVFAFVGLEYSCPLAEELKRPARDLPWGMFLGLALIAVPLVLFGLAATRYLSPQQLGDASQITHMNVAIAILGDAGRWWMGIVSIMATVATLNAILAGLPRLLYGMALTRQVPRAFGYLLPSTRAPVVGIALVALAPILMNVSGATTAQTFIELILAGVLGWATAYVLIHVAQMALRWREPGAKRPYRSPLFPVPQLLGIALLVWAAVKIFPDPQVQAHIYRDYLVFLGVSIVLAFAYNAVAMRSAWAQFRPVPLREVYDESAAMAEAEARLGEEDREAETLGKP
jgi:amino acid transporter